MGPGWGLAPREQQARCRSRGICQPAPSTLRLRMLRGTRVSHLGSWRTLSSQVELSHSPGLLPGSSSELGCRRLLPIAPGSRPDPGALSVCHWEQQVKQEEVLQMTLRSSQTSRLAGGGARGRWQGEGQKGWWPHTGSPTGPPHAWTHADTCGVQCHSLEGQLGMGTLTGTGDQEALRRNQQAQQPPPLMEEPPRPARWAGTTPLH